ncbi:MAG: MATE family efflux transporter [Lachnospiraceae bacterium]|nr:MATE family efflux transporter [Lachnospiraceae bacterium]
MMLFAGPMILGNLLQQCYNIADTLIVGRYLGSDALGGVGSAYTLMTFLNSVIIGLCMGSGAVFSVCFGKNDRRKMKDCMVASFLFIAFVTIVINLLAFIGIHSILHILQVPAEVYGLMKEYVRIIFCGIFFVFLYNYSAFLLRGIGNSVAPLYFLGIAAVLNIGLDLLFVVVFNMGVAGAAQATVIAQAVSGIGIVVYVWVREPELRPEPENFIFRKGIMTEIIRHSTAACIQQSVMNFGILMIQGLVNSFGAAVMSAFAAAVKIDSIAYMPAQEFGNAFSLFISQNYGGGKKDRVREAVRQAVKISTVFCLAVSAVIFILAPYLMRLFVTGRESEIIGIGAEYLRIEGSFYCGIGILFLLYGFCRGIEKPEMSLVLTVISLGTRVVLAYLLASVSSAGVLGIWWSIPAGWFLADLVGLFYIRKQYIWTEDNLTTG